ncbi:ABC transporter permease [Ornithinibacillus halophilus]|uniref:ABC-type Na+ efflux pump, permease component n=1 Tax=Ornithinibacillus halophilus TaxID=930117 RepID=A0A1M5DVM9_9BACI|nr:ABC transporter permease [Ornithinibacillus halophilus]SHF71098.1 ABC-type Na+ efflux pump, permease component [Ornithinibacillus halophilus]
MKLLPFELKKILFSKKFLYLTIGIIVAVALLLVRNIIFQSYIQEEERQEVDDLLDISYENSEMHQAIMKDNPDDEDEKEKLLINSSLVNMLYDLRSMIGGENWENRLALKNEYLNRVIEYKEAEGEHPLTFREINHQLALNQKLIDENIPPENETYSIALPNFMKQIVDLFIYFGAIIIVLLLIGEIMSSEFENRSVNLLFTQPLKRTHIITSKFFGSIILYMLTTAIMLASVFLIGTIFGEKGTFDYPLIMERNHEIQFMSISEYIILGITVISVTILLIISLCLLYSLLFKNTLPTLFAVLATLLAGYALTAFITWNPLAWFNPFQYLLPEEIILFQNDSVWWQGIFIILALTILFYFIARQKVKTSKVD